MTRKRLEPDFATRRSPINGHVSAGLADIGGLVAPGGEGALAAVQALYTVFVDLSRPADVLDAALIAAADGLGPLRLLVSRHGAAPLTGLVRSADVIVDPGTGYASLRIEADTPDLTLLPGMFARASVPRGVLPGAPLVPGDAVLRTGGGGAQLVGVSPGGEATRRDVSRGERVIVASGLSPGAVLAIRRQHRVPEGITVPASTRTDEVLPSDPQH